MIDTIEYTFIEWLVRQGVFAAFKKNYARANPSRMSFRGCLRRHIQHVLNRADSGPSRLIFSAFVFVSTPEGADFWTKQSNAWGRFCLKLRMKF